MDGRTLQTDIENVQQSGVNLVGGRGGREL